MLKKFEVRNYKNFKNTLCIDFGNTAGYSFSSDCICDGIISKMLIYGRNATGKTNLGKALMDIHSVLFDDLYYRDDRTIFNADSKEKTVCFSYVFCFQQDEVIYQYTRLSNREIGNEKLILNGSCIFQCDYINRDYQFFQLDKIEAETANKDRFVQSLKNGSDAGENGESKITFLRWLTNNVVLKANSVLIKLSEYVSKMVMIIVSGNIWTGIGLRSNSFFDFLENPLELQNLEEFLNVMGIECKLVMKKLPDGQRELYFKHERLVSFYENASSGTLALMHLYRRVLLGVRGFSFLYLDEFDAFYHYEMAENVIKFLKKKYPQCQIIMTSHNTNLLSNRIMRPDCLFILSGKGRLTALCNATQRELREGHNLEKMYISGEFEQYE